MSERHAGIDDPTRWLERAQEADNRRDPIKMLEGLGASRYLDGLTRRLQNRRSSRGARGSSGDGCRGRCGAGGDRWRGRWHSSALRSSGLAAAGEGTAAMQRRRT